METNLNFNVKKESNFPNIPQHVKIEAKDIKRDDIILIDNGSRYMMTQVDRVFTFSNRIHVVLFVFEWKDITRGILLGDYLVQKNQKEHSFLWTVNTSEKFPFQAYTEAPSKPTKTKAKTKANTKANKLQETPLEAPEAPVEAPEAKAKAKPSKPAETIQETTETIQETGLNRS